MWRIHEIHTTTASGSVVHLSLGRHQSGSHDVEQTTLHAASDDINILASHVSGRRVVYKSL